MFWLVLYPLSIAHRILQLYETTDMNYKLLLVALAALNFFTCYLLEVRRPIIKTNWIINEKFDSIYNKLR